jgi:hypothetical protein
LQQSPQAPQSRAATEVVADKASDESTVLVLMMIVQIHGDFGELWGGVGVSPK